MADSAVTSTTRVSRRVKAPRARVYAAILDPVALAAWLPPGSMTGIVHLLEPRVGGKIRMTLTYKDPGDSPGGKTTLDSDTVEGRFTELVPNERVVWAVQFESDDPAFSGEMHVHFLLADADGGTEVVVLCEGIPAGVHPKDNEAGSRGSLEKLAAFLE